MKSIEPKSECGGACKRLPEYPHSVRQSNGGDIGFIVSSWTESWHKNSPEMRHVRFGVYRNAMRRRVVGFLERCTTLVACVPEDSSHILGWVCAERRNGVGVVHYVYVAQARREQGLAALLVRSALERIEAPLEGWVYTHPTYLGARIANRRGHSGNYNPCVAWETEDQQQKAVVG